MPVTKFSSFRDAEEALWCFTPDDNYYQRIRRLFELASRLRRVTPVPGVVKFRSMAERETRSAQL